MSCPLLSQAIWWVLLLLFARFLRSSYKRVSSRKPGEISQHHWLNLDYFQKFKKQKYPFSWSPRSWRKIIGGQWGPRKGSLPPEPQHPEPLWWRCQHLPSLSPSWCPQARWPCPCYWCLHSPPPSPELLGMSPVALQGRELQSRLGSRWGCRLPSAPGGKGSRGVFSCSGLTLALATKDVNNAYIKIC